MSKSTEIKSFIERFKKNELERVELNSEISGYYYPIFTELSKNHNKVEFYKLLNELPIGCDFYFGVYKIWTLYNNDKDDDFFDREYSSYNDEELFDY